MEGGTPPPPVSPERQKPSLRRGLHAKYSHYQCQTGGWVPPPPYGVRGRGGSSKKFGGVEGGHPGRGGLPYTPCLTIPGKQVLRRKFHANPQEISGRRGGRGTPTPTPHGGGGVSLVTTGSLRGGHILPARPHKPIKHSGLVTLTGGHTLRARDPIGGSDHDHLRPLRPLASKI
jgi:hypothetical protein